MRIRLRDSSRFESLESVDNSSITGLDLLQFENYDHNSVLITALVWHPHLEFLNDRRLFFRNRTLIELLYVAREQSVSDTLIVMEYLWIDNFLTVGRETVLRGNPK